MNNKLKTLNEIINCQNKIGAEGTICTNCGNLHTITEELLKQEAINWVKAFENIPDNFEITSNPQEKTITYRLNGNIETDEAKIDYYSKACVFYSSGMIGWIKHFFNITEDELE